MLLICQQLPDQVDCELLYGLTLRQEFASTETNPGILLTQPPLPPLCFFTVLELHELKIDLPSGGFPLSIADALNRRALLWAEILKRKCLINDPINGQRANDVWVSGSLETTLRYFNQFTGQQPNAGVKIVQRCVANCTVGVIP